MEIGWFLRKLGLKNSTHADKQTGKLPTMAFFFQLDHYEQEPFLTKRESKVLEHF